MKCYVHPKEDAVAVCKSCGKGVCSNCAVEINGVAYCKTCVESKAVAATSRETQVAMPLPSGIPSKTHFIIGGVGAIISGIAALMFLFIGGLALLWWSGAGGYYMNSASLAGFVILGIGLILAGIGYLGISRNFRKGVATASFAFCIIVTVFLFITAAFGLIWSSQGYYYYYYSSPWYTTYIIAVIVTLVLFGVMQILWGVSHIQAKQYIGNSGLSLATGIMFIISGALTVSILVSFVGMILFCVSNIMAAIGFILTKTPSASS